MSTEPLFTIPRFLRTPIVVRAETIEIKGRQFGFATLGLIRLHMVTIPGAVMPSLKFTIDLCDKQKAVVESLSTGGVNREEAKRLASTLEEVAKASYPTLQVFFRNQ